MVGHGRSPLCSALENPATTATTVPQEHAVKEAEAAAAEPPKTGGKGKESLSNADLARLIVVKPVSSWLAARL